MKRACSHGSTSSLGAATVVFALLLLLGGCSTAYRAVVDIFDEKDGAPARVPVNVYAVPDAVPRVEPRSRSGNPPSYVVNGRRYYVLSSSAGYVERGIASWYGKKFHGRRTASGEIYDMYAMTAAHRTLPLPTYVRVTNLRNGRSVVVRVNDRGPFHKNRLIDLSYAAAAKLGILGTGTGLVEVRAIDPRRPQPRAPVRVAHEAGEANLYLQVGAFVQRRNAERLRQQLLAAHLPRIHIQHGRQGDLPVYRVRIGPLATVDEADRLSDRLARLGIEDSHIVID